MFKNKSPMGKQNFINQWYINQQVKGGISPNKTNHLYSETSFSKARKHKNNNSDRYTQPAPQLKPRHLSDPFDLQCNQTLQFDVPEPLVKKTSAYEMQTDLLCEEEISPLAIQTSPTSPLLIKRLQTLLNYYMEDQKQMRQRIKDLEAELQARNGNIGQIPFNRHYQKK